MSKVGEMRQSAALTTFGIGTMIDFVTGSFMPLGLDDWPPRTPENRIHEPHLEGDLRLTQGLQAPNLIDDDSKYLHKVVRFPKWLVCNNPFCDHTEKRGSALGPIVEFMDEAPHYPPEGGVRFEARNGQIPKCLSCRPGYGIPPRFVVVCQPGNVGPGNGEPEHPGHISDFPWDEWCHGDIGENAGEDAYPHRNEFSKRFWLKNSGSGLSFDDLRVTCECGSSRSLRGILQRSTTQPGGNGPQNQAFPLGRCEGRSPWLNTQVQCNNPRIVIQRGSTSIHVPETKTYISIPPYTSWIRERLASTGRLDDILDRWRDLEQALHPQIPDPDNFAANKANEVVAARLFPETPRDNIDALKDRIKRTIINEIAPRDPIAPQIHNQNTLRDRKLQEYQHLSEESGSAGDNFYTVMAHESAGAFGLININKMRDVMKVERLKAVTAFMGFRREVGGGSLSDPESQTQRPYARLYRPNGEADGSIDDEGRPISTWLPAMELKGEGLFFQFQLDRLNEFTDIYLRNSNGLNRINLILNKTVRLEEARGALYDQGHRLNSPAFHLKRILVHTFSHLLIRQLTLTCGYGSASLQERLYLDDDNCGVLIYTSTPGAEGSLGGLVRMGNASRLGPLITDMLDQARWCSADPICQDSLGQGSDGLNLAACHGCALVPETSCESLRNTHLDRALVVRPNGSPLPPGYFDEWN